MKREREKKEKNRSDTPIVAPVKIVIFFYRKEGIRVEREEKKHAYLSLRSRFYVSSESERVNC